MFGAARMRHAALPPRPHSSACLTGWEKLLRSRVWLPGDEDFAPGCNPARAEALRASGKQLVEACLQQAAKALFEVRAQGPERPLVPSKARHCARDGCFTGGSWDD